MKYKRIEKKFDYKDFEPYIDAKTMETHFEKHHQGYLNKLGEALEKHNFKLDDSDLISLMKSYQDISDVSLKVAIRQFGGGLINHNFFFDNLKIGTELNGQLKEKIIAKWGSFEEFQKDWEETCMKLFGSGWVWLGKQSDGDLVILKTFNQDNIYFLGFKPIIGIDLWEHAYYLQYKSDRLGYVKAFWNVIDWDKANKSFES